MTTPTCTCHPVLEQYHTTHYGATEPGSTLEPDYGCPVHFPKPKRKWGDAPGLIRGSRFTYGHIVACRLCPPSSTGAPRNFAWPQGDLQEAVEVLAEHQRAEHACPALWEVDGASLRCELLAGHVEIGSPADHSWVQDLPIRIEPQASERSGA